MHIFQELKTLISHIYFKTIVIDNLHLFRKWRGSSPDNYPFPPIISCATYNWKMQGQGFNFRRNMMGVIIVALGIYFILKQGYLCAWRVLKNIF